MPHSPFAFRPWKRVRGAWASLWRFIHGNDVFISYARSDGQRYALGLQSSLSKRLTVLMDLYVGQPSIDTPMQVRKGLQRCRQLVVVATPAALTSKSVEDEIRLFPLQKRPVQVITFGNAIETARWFDAIPGLSRQPEDSSAMATGQPTQEIVDVIDNSIGYWRQRKRVVWTTATAVLLTTGSLIAFAVVSYRLYDVNEQVKIREKALSEKTSELEGVKVSLGNAEGNLQTTKREADERNAIVDIETRQRLAGYISPDDLPRAIRAASTLRELKLDSDGVTPLAAAVETLPRLLKRWRIPGGIRSYATLPGNRSILVWDGGAVLTEWDYVKGTAGKLRLQHEEEIQSWTVSEGGATVVSFTRNAIHVWKLPDGELVFRADCTACSIAEFSHNGRYLAVSLGGSIRLFDLQEKKDLPLIRLSQGGGLDQDRPTGSIPFFSANDDTILAIVMTSLGVFKRQNRLEAFRLSGESIDPTRVLPQNCLTPSPASRLEVLGAGLVLISHYTQAFSKRLRVCSLAENRASEMGPFGSNNEIRAITLDKGRARLLASEEISGAERRVSLFEVFDGASISSLSTTNGATQVFSRDGRFFATSGVASFAPEDHAAVLVGASEDGRLRCVVPLKAPWEFIGLSDDGRYVTLGSRTIIGVSSGFREFETWECEGHQRLTGLVHGGELDALAFGSDGSVSLVNYGSGEAYPVLSLASWQARIGSVSVVTRLNVASADSAPNNGNQRLVRLWSIPAQKELAISLPVITDGLRPSSLGFLNLGVEDDSLGVKGISPYRDLLQWPIRPHPSSGRYQYRFLQNARFVWKATAAGASVFDLLRRREIRFQNIAAESNVGARDIAELPSGYRLVLVEPEGVSGGSTVHVVESPSWQDVLAPISFRSEVQTALSDDGKFLLTAADGRLTVWNVEERRKVSEIRESDQINRVGFGPSSRWIWHDTGHQIRMRLWDLKDLLQVACDASRLNQLSAVWPKSPADSFCVSP